MSLQVWLPLNGNLDNNGASGLTFTNGSTANLTVNATGKIGSCYQRATLKTTGYIGSSDRITLSGDITMACWAYVTECVGDTANGLVTNHSHADSSGVGITVKQVSTSDYRISCNTGTGSSRTYCSYYGTTNIKNAWHHLALTYSKSSAQLKLYVDGVVEYTLNSYSNYAIADYIRLFEWSTTHDAINYRPAAKLNDVRIYDNCLSLSEIKDLAKGLVLHYPMNDQYLEPTSNGLSGNTLDLSGWSSYGFGSHGVKTIMSGVEGVCGGHVCKVTDGYTNTSNQSIEMATWATLPAISKGQTVTFSAWVKGEGATIGKTCFLHIYNSNGTNTQSDTVVSTTLTANWKRIGGTLTWRYDTASSTSYSCYVVCQMCQNEYFYFCNPQIESKNHVTPYTATSRSGNKVYDTSGYNITGTLSGTPSLQGTSPRYANSTLMTGCSISHAVPLGCRTINQEWTCSAWVYPTANSSSYMNSFNHANYLYYGAGGRPLLYLNSGDNDYYTYGNTVLPLNTWTLVTFVFRNSDGFRKVYFNGALADAGGPNKTSTPSGINTTITSFSGFNGYVSDYRIYATALSAQDVLDLYNAPIKIAKSGALITNGEVVE